MRKVILTNEEIYHVFNRGIELRSTFTDRREFLRGILSIDFYRFNNSFLGLAKALNLNLELRENYLLKLKQDDKKLVNIIAYCLMPNHFHFLLKQKIENGISKFMSNFTNSYTRYFNTKNKRVGPLFQGTFKSVYIESDEQLLHVSRYIHLNPVVSYVIKEQELVTYSWSSLPEYLGLTKEKICDKEIVLNQFPSRESYRKFVHDQIDYAQKLEKIKHLIIEE